mmetsp:Transcript_25199/g.50549  ORF Transcript_25199/g.50549 Transcript_25199/m.50549 type:complete len:282 (+) Transcript_25199:696-1541(+)
MAPVKLFPCKLKILRCVNCPKLRGRAPSNPLANKCTFWTRPRCTTTPSRSGTLSLMRSSTDAAWFRSRGFKGGCRFTCTFGLNASHSSIHFPTLSQPRTRSQLPSSPPLPCQSSSSTCSSSAKLPGTLGPPRVPGQRSVERASSLSSCHLSPNFFASMAFSVSARRRSAANSSACAFTPALVPRHFAAFVASNARQRSTGVTRSSASSTISRSAALRMAFRAEARAESRILLSSSCFRRIRSFSSASALAWASSSALTSSSLRLLFFFFFSFFRVHSQAVW